MRAGAGAFHLHPRDAAGDQTLEPEHVLAAVAAVRAATGLPVGVTTGIWTVQGDVRRGSTWSPAGPATAARTTPRST